MNGPDKHSAVIVTEGFSAFVDGIPDKCEHDYNGDSVCITASGKVIWWHTFKKWASYTEEMRLPLIHEHQNEINDPVVEQAVTCVHCKKIFQPPMFDE